MDSDPSDSNFDALQSAKASLHNTLRAQEKHWKQKSRIKWLAEGDRNTKFFHLISKIRGSSNSIDKISVNGNLLTSKGEIQEASANHFEQIFKAQSTPINADLFTCEHPMVSAQQNSSLQSIPDANEIRATVFSLNRSGAPRADGFSGHFYTSC